MRYIEISLYTAIVVIILFFIYKQVRLYVNSVRIKSTIDGKYYTVRDTSNKQQTADTLAIINSRVSKLLLHLNRSHPGDKNVRLLIERYNPSNIMENIELDNTTYTVNKGREVSVCIATRNSDEKIYDINKLMFVIIHELAHIGAESIGHNDEFRRFFSYLLRQSMAIGIYEYQDYSKKPEEYCGTMISATPV